jgi:hypothetical protein
LNRLSNFGFENWFFWAGKIFSAAKKEASMKVRVAKIKRAWKEVGTATHIIHVFGETPLGNPVNLSGQYFDRHQANAAGAWLASQLGAEVELCMED